MTLRNRRRLQAASMAVLGVATNGFLARSRFPLTRMRVFSRLDDLMDDVLNDRSFSVMTSSNTSMSASTASVNGWRQIDWEEVGSKIEPTEPSNVDIIVVRDRLVYLKRDDQLRLGGSQISGNKARKMLTLNGLQDFPACVASYGGPQSNAMLALAAVVHFHNTRVGLPQDHPDRKRFIYYTKKLPRFLRSQPSGNLFRALSLGMEMIELSSQDYADLFGSSWGAGACPPPGLTPPVHGDSLWIPQGGACEAAIAGTQLLAKEILDYWANHGKERPLTVCLPGGTCSTALFLHRAIKSIQGPLAKRESLDIEVVVIPCVGDDGYARRQMMGLNAQSGHATDDIPTVLPPAPCTDPRGQATFKPLDYFSFGVPNKLILETYHELRDECDVVLDLLYGAPSWTILLRHWRSQSQSAFDSAAPINGRQVMYVHSGGLEGINSQLLRYRYKGLVESDETQLPGRNG